MEPIIQALEKWVLNHPEEQTKEPYIVKGTKVYNMVELLEEVKKGSDDGNEFLQQLVYLTVDLLARKQLRIF